MWSVFSDFYFLFSRIDVYFTPLLALCMLAVGLDGVVFFKSSCYTYEIVALGGLVVACLPLDPRFVGSNPAKNDGFLRTIKIRSTTSFREVKPLVPCRKILRHVNEPYKYVKWYLAGKIHGHFSPSVSCFGTRCHCWQLPESSSG
jgi:hypothetical protein